jgi:nicotinate-nucleotide adenylyltransferase
MKVGLFFGSFNPIHHGHLIIASHILQNSELDQIWFIVSPHNPLKENRSLLNEYQRLHLVRLATEGYPGFRVMDIEFRLPKPSYTVDTLTYLEENFPDHVFNIIMGSDSLHNIEKWKNPSVILERYEIYLYIRPGFDVRKDLLGKINVVKAPLLEISATHIRKLINEGHSIRYFVPETVRDEIEMGGYYKSLKTPAKN